MVRISIFAASVFAALAPVTANAAQSSPTTRSLLLASLDHKEVATAEGRSQLVVAVREYCVEVEQDYPKNSPSEDQWLAGEIQGGGERVTRAIASPEMGRRMAASFTEDCATWSNAMERNPDNARNYVGLAHTFVRFMGDAEYFASKNGLDPERYAFGTALHATVETLLMAALIASNPET